MTEIANKISLQDGTLVRHKVIGYQGTIEGKTEIKTCFTRGGALLAIPPAKEAFQYRVVVSGETMRHIAPAEDLEILDAMTEVVCFRCHYAFRTKPGVVDKASGRCQCGGWICPACMACQTVEAPEQSQCAKQRKRMVKKLADEKKSKRV
jgi:hypothetical protein